MSDQEGRRPVVMLAGRRMGRASLLASLIEHEAKVTEARRMKEPELNPVVAEMGETVEQIRERRKRSAVSALTAAAAALIPGITRSPTPNTARGQGGNYRYGNLVGARGGAKERAKIRKRLGIKEPPAPLSNAELADALGINAQK